MNDADTLYLIACNGTFRSRTNYTTSIYPISVVVVDVNNDNKPDIVIANSGSNTVGVLLNAVNGAFLSQTIYTTGSSPHSVAVVDVNNDNKPDMVVSNDSPNNLGVFLHC